MKKSNPLKPLAITKKLYAKLIDSFLKDVDELGKTVPAQSKEAYQKQLETQKVAQNG